MDHGELMKLNRAMRCEENASKHINILTHYADDTLQDKSGKLIKIIKVNGLDFITKSDQELDSYKIRRNNLLKQFSSEFAFYFWQVRSEVNNFPNGTFADGFAKQVNVKYQSQKNTNKLYKNDHYLAIITKPAEGLFNKSYALLNQLNQLFDKKSKAAYLAKRYKELKEVTRKILNTLSDYHCELLSKSEKDGVKFSEPLAFLSQIINKDSISVPLHIEDAASILPRKRVFFNGKSGTIEMRSANGESIFAAMLSIKAYAPITSVGMLDELSSINCEYIITQSYRPYDRQRAKIRLLDHQKEMLQSNEESISQTDQIDEVFDDTASGAVGYGKHHLSMTCYAETQEILNKNVAKIVALFSDADIVCVREDVACELAFWAQLPGNFGYIARPADISTKNMSSLANFHNFSTGKLKGNHWGDAVTVFETLSGSPYYFNFHYKDVGNFLIFGAMGSGKTVLVGFLILQSMKFGGKRIIFDKDRGLEIMVRAMGGVYETIKPGIHTGFNPCQLIDAPHNRQFLFSLFKKILTVNGDVINEADAEIIKNAINGLYRLDLSSRQFCHIASFFGRKSPGSLRARFDQWHSDGAHAWVFDNAQDSLNLDPDVMGFDLGALLKEEECKTPALMYLTYRVEQAIEGHRGILFCDEGWNFLGDEYFKKMINDWSRTPRKKDNIFGLATQVANDTVHSEISKSLNESSFCKIFFPNSSADRKVYMEDFGLSEQEYDLIKTLPDDQYFFLLNYGRSTNKQSVVIKVNLSGLEEEIAIISARENSLQLLDQILSEVGDKPSDWLPIFNSKLKEFNQ